METVLIDGECRMCQAFGRGVERYASGRCSVAHIASPVGQTLLGKLNETDRMAGVHLVRANGSRVSGVTAALEIGRGFPGGRWIAWLGSRAPRLTEAVYQFVARNRNRIRG